MVNDLILPKLVRGSDTRSCSADVERLGQFDEFGAGWCVPNHVQTKTKPTSQVVISPRPDQINFSFLKLVLGTWYCVIAPLMPQIS